MFPPRLSHISSHRSRPRLRHADFRRLDPPRRLPRPPRRGRPRNVHVRARELFAVPLTVAAAATFEAAAAGAPGPVSVAPVHADDAASVDVTTSVDDQVDEVGASEAVASVLTPLEAFQLLGREDFARVIDVQELTDIFASVTVVRGAGCGVAVGVED